MDAALDHKQLSGPALNHEQAHALLVTTHSRQVHHHQQAHRSSVAHSKRSARHLLCLPTSWVESPISCEHDHHLPAAMTDMNLRILAQQVIPGSASRLFSDTMAVDMTTAIVQSDVTHDARRSDCHTTDMQAHRSRPWSAYNAGQAPEAGSAAISGRRCWVDCLLRLSAAPHACIGKWTFVCRHAKVLQVLC
jgi:hypothetical protein